MLNQPVRTQLNATIAELSKLRRVLVDDNKIIAASRHSTAAARPDGYEEAGSASHASDPTHAASQ